jgi:hypothetical protein
MRYHIIGAFVFFVTTFCGQTDSAAKRRALFDVYATVGPQLLPGDNGDQDFYTHFTPDGQPLNIPAGYTVTNNVTENGSGGFGVAAGASFRLNKPEGFKKRIKPRIGLHYSSNQVFLVFANLSRVTTIDTLKYSDPRLKPLIIIDSTYREGRNFSLTYQQIFVDLGANVDVFTFRYFNFFTGILFSAGVSFQQQFVTEQYTTSYVDPYPGEEKHSSTILSQSKPIYNYPSTIAFNLAIPVGIQHRFSNRGRNSIGLFVEGRGGISYYQPPKSGPLLNPFLFIQLGLRWSFQKHK